MSEQLISHSIPLIAQMVNVIQQELAAANAMQVESEDVNQYFDFVAFNPIKTAQQFQRQGARGDLFFSPSSNTHLLSL